MAGSLSTVQLRHELPDGTAHIDWMIATDERGEGALITFRIAEPLDRLEPGGEMIAERLVEHRAAYLTYEGPVSGDRGSVTRIASGVLEGAIERPPPWSLRVCWDRGVVQVLDVRPDDDGRWRVSLASATGPS